MTRYIPPGREDLYRRQAVADAEVKRLEAEFKAAEREAGELARARLRDDARVEDADARVDRLYAEFCRAEDRAERIYDERTAGLSYWIDTCPHLPICSACGGTGGPRPADGGIADARTSCRTCRGWGREDDGRGHLPVWHEGDKAWYDPATGRRVEVPEPSLDDPPAKPDKPTENPPDDIHDLRRGRWYDEKPITTTTTSAGRTGMANIEEVRAAIMAAIEKMNEGLGVVQQGHATLEEAQSLLMQATEGSGQGDVSTANGLLAQSVNDLDQASQQVTSAISESEGVANRL